jgi:hypothetical protein
MGYYLGRLGVFEYHIQIYRKNYRTLYFYCYAAKFRNLIQKNLLVQNNYRSTAKKVTKILKTNYEREILILTMLNHRILLSAMEGVITSGSSTVLR